MTVYINRILNLKHIKAIGFDMDYTLVRYHSKAFEQLSYDAIVSKLIKHKGYPKEIAKLKFSYNKAIRGLVFDRKNGNLLKVSTFGKIKFANHGTKKMMFKEQRAFYKGEHIDLNSSNYTSVDTSFAIAHAVLYAQLVDLRDSKPSKYPNYEQIDTDVKEQLDIAHYDGTLKDEVRKNLKKYIKLDPQIVNVLRNFKNNGKKLWVITNSDFHYSKLLLDYTINRYLKDGNKWSDLFDIVITSSMKPTFFEERRQFLEIDPETGYLKNTYGPFTKGIFQGGSADVLQKDNSLADDEILYLGDHIYGDILTLKKSCNWRTGLVIEELASELEKNDSNKPISKKISKLMTEKEKLELKIDSLYKKTDKTNLKENTDAKTKEKNDLKKAKSKIL
ncbi:MAG: HAD superfamily 5'-nucleotidase-like hydrolase, partial [Thermoproteota archaeon]